MEQKLKRILKQEQSDDINFICRWCSKQYCEGCSLED